jgi:hypothetical protein
MVILLDLSPSARTGQDQATAPLRTRLLSGRVHLCSIHNTLSAEQLKKHCAEVEKNDFIDARIAFLQHQVKSSLLFVTGVMHTLLASAQREPSV